MRTSFLSVSMSTGCSLKCPKKHVKDVFCTWRHIHFFLKYPKTEHIHSRFFSRFKIDHVIWKNENEYVRFLGISRKNVSAVTCKTHPSNAVWHFRKLPVIKVLKLLRFFSNFAFFSVYILLLKLIRWWYQVRINLSPRLSDYMQIAGWWKISKISTFWNKNKIS